MPDLTHAQRIEDITLGLDDTIADFIGIHCPTEFPAGADQAAELIMREIVTPLAVDLERARRIAVTLEQENAALRHVAEQDGAP